MCCTLAPLYQVQEKYHTLGPIGLLDLSEWDELSARGQVQHSSSAREGGGIKCSSRKQMGVNSKLPSKKFQSPPKQGNILNAMKALKDVIIPITVKYFVPSIVRLNLSDVPFAITITCCTCSFNGMCFQ